MKKRSKFSAGFPGNFRALLMIVLTVISFSASAQYDSTKLLQDQNSYGFRWKNGKFRYQLTIPQTDTITMAVADSGSVAFYNGAFYGWDGYTWGPIGGGITIYTGNGTLNGDRDIDADAHDFRINDAGEIGLAGTIVTLSANAGSNHLHIRSDSSSLNKIISYESNLRTTFTQHSLIDKNYTDSVAAIPPALTATQIAFGDGSNLMTSSNNLLWDNSTKTMTLDSNTFNKNTYTMLGHPSTNIPTLIQMRRNGGSAPLFWGAIGAGGSTEINQFNNLDYRTSSHLYYDSTKNAIWTYLGYTNGFGIQFVPKDNPNNDIFNLYGKEIFSVDLSLQPSTGVAKRFMSQINSAGINIVDRGGTRYTNSANDTKLYVENASIYLTGGTGVSRFFSTGNLRISPDGYNTYADATAISTFTDSANSTYSIYENKGNNTNYNRFRYIKTLASSYNIGAGQKIIETDYNGGVAYDGVRATSTVTGGFSNAEFYWKTTNTAGVNAERMTLSEDGNLGLGTVTPSKVLHTVGTVRHASLGTASTDTTTYKPVGINSSGDLIGMTAWPSGGGGGSGSGITVGTTTISSGTSGRIGYNNAGVYNEYTTTGTGTEVVKSTSPTINADITLTGAYANLNINANTATNSFVSLGVNGTIYGYYGACGNTNAFITGSAVGDMCFRGVNDNILFSTNNGTSSQMTIKSTGVVQMSNYGAGTATFDASGNISSVSDERLKTAIKPYTSGLKQLLLLKPIQYKWNEKSGNETKETYAGFSAQNVKSAIPYGTGENKDGYLSLQERAIVATLVNAVKEQQQQIEELKREIIKLKN